MTDTEFAKWSTRLFVAFPSLWEWLNKNSPSPKETQALWRKTLAGYTLAECDAVLDDWSSGAAKPFEAYERDKVHLIVRSMVALKRDRAAKRKSLAENSAPYMQKRRGEFDLAAVLGDSSMVAALLELRPVHRRMLDGEVSEADYEVAKIEAMEKHGMNKKATA